MNPTDRLSRSEPSEGLSLAARRALVVRRACLVVVVVALAACAALRIILFGRIGPVPFPAWWPIAGAGGVALVAACWRDVVLQRVSKVSGDSSLGFRSVGRAAEIAFMVALFAAMLAGHAAYRMAVDRTPTLAVPAMIALCDDEICQVEWKVDGRSYTEMVDITDVELGRTIWWQATVKVAADNPAVVVGWPESPSSYWGRLVASLSLLAITLWIWRRQARSITGKLRALLPS